MLDFSFPFVHFSFSTALLGFLFLPFRLSVSASQWLCQCRLSSHFHASPFFPVWFLIHSFLVHLLGSLFVSFRPSLLRSHSRSTSACLLLSLSAFPLIIDFLSSVSSSVLTTWSLFLPFHSFWFYLTVVFPVYDVAFAIRFPLSFRPNLSCLSSRFLYLASCLFLFALSCFAPTAVPQVIPFDCSLGTSTWLRFPFVHLSF